MNFSEFNFHPHIAEGVQTMGFEQATPIQEQAIPIILNGKDLIGCAQTGTGKTAAFVLPVLSMLAERQHDDSHVRVLIIVPTRELALQIDQAVEGFSYYSNVGSIAVYGGNDGKLWDTQRAAITNGTEIVIATPGRLFQHIQMGYVDFSHVQYLVLDEADRMLDMGFYDDIMEIIKLLPEQRHTMMFSATMPPKIRELAKAILHEPEEISIAVSKPADNITQMAYIVADHHKIELLGTLLKDKEEEVRSAIVFVGRKADVRNVEMRLKRIGISARAIFSDIEQREREEVLREFKNRKFQVLVATDIISRGIDIEDIDLVVNYDIPKDPEDYVHRIGRTARAQSDGVAITLISPDKRYDFTKIEKFLEAEIYKQSYKQPSPDQLPPTEKPHPNGGRRRGQGGGRNGHRGGGPRPNGRSKDKDKDNGTNAAQQQQQQQQPSGEQPSQRRRHGGKRRRPHHRGGNSPAQGEAKPQS